MDITQIIIIISLVLITGTIVASGVWLIKIFKELKVTITKTNQILDDTQSITSSIAKPVNSFSEFVMGFKNGFHLFNNLFDKKDKKDD
jgi:Na+-transporting NADH:ubiquinone oxidoreductase subunit NqrC